MCFGSGKSPYIDRYGYTNSFLENPGPCRVNPDWDPKHPQRCSKVLRLEEGETPVLPDPAAVRLGELRDAEARRRGYQPVQGMVAPLPPGIRATASASGAGSVPGESRHDSHGTTGNNVTGASRRTATEAGAASGRSGTYQSRRSENDNNTSRRTATEAGAASGRSGTYQSRRSENSNNTSRRAHSENPATRFQPEAVPPPRYSPPPPSRRRNQQQSAAGRRPSAAHSEIPATRFQPDVVPRRSSPPPLSGGRRNNNQQSAGGGRSASHSQIQASRFQPDSVRRRPSPPPLSRNRR